MGLALCLLLLPWTGVAAAAADPAYDAVLVKDINPGSGHSFPGEFTDFAGTMFFRAVDAVNGSELWTSDGTPERGPDGWVEVVDPVPDELAQRSSDRQRCHDAPQALAERERAGAHAGKHQLPQEQRVATGGVVQAGDGRLLDGAGQHGGQQLADRLGAERVEVEAGDVPVLPQGGDRVRGGRAMPDDGDDRDAVERQLEQECRTVEGLQDRP